MQHCQLEPHGPSCSSGSQAEVCLLQMGLIVVVQAFYISIDQQKVCKCPTSRNHLLATMWALGTSEARMQQSRPSPIKTKPCW